jgi:kanamycin kinase
MKRQLIGYDPNAFPVIFQPLLQSCPVYDSSCSPDARVYFLDWEDGLYLKRAFKGSLQKESAMTAYFHSKGLATEVLAYESLDEDWLLTRRVKGEDCIDPAYLADPKRLCDTTATLLRMLHDTAPTDCPVAHTTHYIATAQKNYLQGKYDPSLFPDNWGYASPEEAWKVIEANTKYLKTDTLLHGDYCLPNIMLDRWQFSGFIDLGNGGIGDRHIDLFWGIWSLQFNLKTSQYRDRFLDAYGRELVCEDMFPIISAFEVFG